MSTVTVTHVPPKSRYEAHVDGDLAGYVEYEQAEGTITFTHTRIDSAFEGRGIGGALARGALDSVCAKGDRTVVAQCEFIQAWIAKHPEYEDRLTP